jgi:hypothetical protein
MNVVKKLILLLEILERVFRYNSKEQLIPSYTIIRICGDVCITSLKDDEDFMSIELWNLSEDKKKISNN